MTKVTIKETPTSEIVAKAATPFIATDARGRNITLKKPGVLAQFRLIEALGETARNEVYVRMVMPLLYVSEIDGDLVTPLSRKSEIEALIQRLDEDGIVAVGRSVEELFGAPDPEADKAKLGN